MAGAGTIWTEDVSVLAAEGRVRRAAGRVVCASTVTAFDGLVVWATIGKIAKGEFRDTEAVRALEREVSRAAWVSAEGL